MSILKQRVIIRSPSPLILTDSPSGTTSIFSNIEEVARLDICPVCKREYVQIYRHYKTRKCLECWREELMGESKRKEDPNEGHTTN